MPIFFSDITALNTVLKDKVKPYTSVFILCDENTEKHCLPLVKSALLDAHLVVISSGEHNKNLQTCEHIWSELTDKIADRKSLLINFGGGVIGDMGGFAASCYKRGTDFINIPTTLLAMVDASVGGKTGIDFHNFKNQIGVFSEAKEVLICNEFLKTLDQRQIRSGLAEVAKHYLIADGPAFLDFSRTYGESTNIELIKRAVAIKSDIVAQDPFEKNVRKKLNFGHTIGHAMESYSLTTPEPLLHGEAIAYGMAVETYIAAFKSLIDEEKAGFVCQTLESVFALKPLSAGTIEAILRYTRQDKKNERGAVKMSLIDEVGSCQIDIEVSADEMREAIAYFNKSVTPHVL
jgi:3-dehydroquinate synthase